MSKIRMDFARNEVNAGTLKILDRDFFYPKSEMKNPEEAKDDEA
jgi:hypothetical protein